MAIEKKNFTGGLDSDTEDRFLQPGDYRYALNCRASKSDGSNLGAIENTKGNSIISVTLPDGINKVIGAYDNLTTNKVVYCMFNDSGNHSIYEFDANTETITLVLRTPLLNFKSNKFINDSFMIGGLYFFNDRVNEPRCLNIDRAKVNGYPSPFKEEYMKVIVPAPGKPVTAQYVDDKSINTNNVRGVLFQFRYKYTYLDNEESAWSPISKVALPVDEASFRPFAYYPTDINNAIDLRFDVSDEYVKTIKIAAREGNTGDFFLVTELDRDDLVINQNQVDDVYRFYNDEVYTPIDNDGFTGMRLFDWCPQLADSMSQIDGNRVAFGGITENYDPVDVDLEVIQNLDTSNGEEAPEVKNIYRLDTPKTGGYGITPATPASPDWIFNTSTPFQRKIGSRTYFLTAGTVAKNRSPKPTPLIQLSPKRFYDNSTPFSFDDFIKPNNAFGDRVLLMRSGDLSNGKLITAGESLVNEYLVSAPNAVGTRYTLAIKVRYWDLGNTENIKTETVRVQYTSVANDTEIDVANGLKSALVNIPTIKKGKVSIDFSKTVESGASVTTSNNPGPSQRILRVWVAGVVKEADKEKDPTPSFPIATGPDTPALFDLSGDVKSYASWTLRSEKTLKSGARHGVALVYYDGPNRSGLTNVSKDKTFYVPFFTERSIPIPNGDTPNDVTLDLIIKHKAPSWAKRFQVVYTGNQSIEKLPGIETGYRGFIQFQLKKVAQSTKTGALEAELSNITSYNDTIPEDIDLQYSFTKGDRLRLITEPVVAGVTPNYLTDYRDVEVISYDSTTKVAVFKDPGVTLSDNQMVEIYTPKKKASEVKYFEVGEVYDIVDGFHVGGDVDQDANTDAVIKLDDIGDVYLRYRVSPVGSVVEDYSYSDYYISDVWDKGRPNIVDNNITRTKRESTIRFSGTYIPETNINGLSQFNDFDFEAYDQRYGTIQYMHSDDKDLIVLQTLKVGKVRVGQDTLYSNEGSQVATVKSQNKVLSDIVYYSGEYGIGTNPESFDVYGNRKYFTDVPRGVVLRLSTDGLTPISEIKMHNYFNDTFKRLVDSNGDYRVIGQYDVRFDEYRISIQENIVDYPITNNLSPVETIIPTRVGNDSQYVWSASPAVQELIDVQGIEPDPFESFAESAFVDDQDSRESFVVPVGDPSETAPSVTVEEYLFETIAFSESKKRWITFYSYTPDYMVSNNISFISFKDGQLYTHNTNSLYNNFYGVQYSQKVHIISNVQPDMIKFYSSIAIQATSRFSVPRAFNQFGQKTSLIVEDFLDDEGVFKAAFLRDENTPNVVNPLIEGDDMRCHSMSINLENTDTELVKIFLVEISLSASLLTGK